MLADVPKPSTYPLVAEPVTVVTAPAGVIFLIVFESVTKILPLLSTAVPTGEVNVAVVPNPSTREEVLDPERVVTVAE